MCGIAGVVYAAPAADERVIPSAEAALTASLAVMRHRGPDADGRCSWRSPSGVDLLMGMTRLAVLDLSPAGLQPMSTPDGRFTLAFNGEITNFIEVRRELEAMGVIFTSTGDTEVLLRAWAAWGPSARHRLEGMYAFAILDRHEATLTLCRDPFGIKPLFIAYDYCGRVTFGSEIAAVLSLLDSTPRLNWRVAAHYLVSGRYDSGPDSFIEGIRHLSPGAQLVVDLRSGQHRIVAPDWVPSIRTDASLTPARAADGVRERLEASVRRSLRSDVPVGLALSGGIDSSGIACLVKKLEPEFPIRTFSFVAAGTPGDESRWINIVLSGLGGTWAGVTPEPGDLLRDLDDVIIGQGEPFVSTSIYAQYRVFQLMHESGIVVSLDGQGGDELFAGYQGYPGQRVRSLVETGHFFGAARFLARWSDWPGRSVHKAVARVALETLPRRLAEPLYDRLMAERLVGVADGAVLASRGAAWGASRPFAGADGLRGVRVKAELRTSLLERGLQALLRHGDRNSMRWSVESRVPYLDRELATFVLSMPEEYLVDPAGTSKAVLRAALRGLVPQEILTRRDKVGFEAPDALWLDSQRPRLAAMVREACPIGFLNTAVIADAIEGVGPRAQLDSAYAWRLVNLYRWASLIGVDCS